MAEDSKKLDPLPDAEDQSSSAVQADSSAPQPETESAQLREQLAAAEKEAKDNYDRFLRQVAEFENFKKRSNREKEEAIRFANESLIKDLLRVIDDLERAVAHAKGGGNGKPIVEGVEMVLKELLDVLAKHDAVPITALGQAFDPGKHEAMAQVETDSFEPNTVTAEHHKGYFLRGRLLRPALVSVAKAPADRAKKPADAEVEKPPTDD